MRTLRPLPAVIALTAVTVVSSTRRCGRLASDHSLRQEVGPKGIDYLTDPLLDLVLLHAGTVEPRSDTAGGRAMT